MHLQVRSLAVRGLTGLSLAATVVASASAQQKPLPLKYVGPATVPAITSGDLMTRLYKYADDSMGGRPVGTPEHLKAVAYIESEVRRLGLKPGGTNGSYYQDFPIFKQSIDPSSSILVDGRALAFGHDFLPFAQKMRQLDNVQAVWAGNLADTTTSLDSAAVAGKVLVLRGVATTAPIRASAAYKAFQRAVLGAAGLMQVQGDSFPKATIDALSREGMAMETATLARPNVLVTVGTAEGIFGGPLAGIAKGSTGKPVSMHIAVVMKPSTPGRNVVAILPGTDPKLKGEYVAIGAHSDHIAMQMPAREHDSIKVFNAVGRPAGAEGGRTTPLTPEEWLKINADIAEMRKIYPARMDSISNGADDDGSGSVSVLEIAEAFAKGSVKPKRSLIFVWHAGEEAGMWGSGYFMDNPTIPRDSVVAQLNIDMVGRGEATDVTGTSKEGSVLHGSSGYLQLVGSRRLSKELGDMVETVNTTKNHNLTFDYSEDADGHPQNIYCRSDHWSYGKWNIPVVFFTTGGHADYHQITDEPQYIQYGHMARVDSLIFDVAVAVAGMDHRPLVDGKKMDNPNGACKQ